MNCSRCKVPLEAYRISGKEIDLCAKCGGAYYDQGELGIPVLVKDLKPAKTDCPRCGLRMFVGHFGEKQGPELDYCTNCGGVWADKGELNKIRRNDSFAGPSAANAAAAAFTGRPTFGTPTAAAKPSADEPATAKPAVAKSWATEPKVSKPTINRLGKAGHKPPPYGPWVEYWDEFLLYNPEKGFAWLVSEGGHYTLERTTTVRPSRSIKYLDQKRSVGFGGQNFQVYDRGSAVLDEAEGETPWIAKPGDHFESTELIAPPKMVTVEKSKGEVEHFLGEYVEPQEVWDGFKLPGSPPDRHWVHGAQPFHETDFNRQAKWWTLGFALIFGALLVGSAMLSTPTVAMKQNFGPAFPTPFETQSFTVKNPNTVCRLLASTTLSNQWLWIGVDILDDKGGFAGELSMQMEEYHGHSGGEYWSEGNTKPGALFVIKDPGTYSLRIIGEGGTGQGTNNFNPGLSITVETDYVPWRFYLMGFVVTMLIAFIMLSKKATFEANRWGEVIEEEDDDD